MRPESAHSNLQSESLAERLARALLDIEAVTLRPSDPFTWASGWLSPIYCDNRLIMGYPEIRTQTTEGFAALIKQHGLVPEVIAGTATAGIPHAAWLAQSMRKPMVYVRSKPKPHGRGNQIEGPVHAGQQVVVIEDLVSTGKSSMAAVRALRAQGVEVQAVLAIFSYGFAAASEVFGGAGLPCYTLSNYDTLLEVAAARGQISDLEREALKAWRADPQAWSGTV